MRTFLALVFAGLLMESLASAAGQSVPEDTSRETIIVNGKRIPNTPNGIAHAMIETYAAPSPLLNQLTRWRIGICPRTDGLSSRNLNDYVTARIREVAALAGAPVKPLPCKPNIQVFFTDDPQAALDEFHKKNSLMLGYHGAVKVSHSIQAWYETGTTDINGLTILDEDTMGHIEFTNGGGLVPDSNGRLVEHGIAVTDGIPHTTVEGWKARPEVTSDFISVLILADSRKTGIHKLGAIGDYVAMLALSRTEAYETCEIVPSIANEMASGCDPKLMPEKLSLSDIGYLRGLYNMDAGATLKIQQDDIAGEMLKAQQAGK
jgi:hypothetical protein